MYEIQKQVTKDQWVKVKTYKVFENAEKKLYEYYAQGVSARMVERK